VREADPDRRVEREEALPEGIPHGQSLERDPDAGHASVMIGGQGHAPPV